MRLFVSGHKSFVADVTCKYIPRVLSLHFSELSPVEQKFLILMDYFFSFMNPGITSKNFWPNLRSQKVSPMFCSRSFRVLHFILNVGSS